MFLFAHTVVFAELICMVLTFLSSFIACLLRITSHQNDRLVLKGRRRTLPPRARRIAQREALLIRMFVRLARRMLRVALAARAQMRMEPATMVPPRMFPLFTHNKRAIIVRSVLMVRPPSAARILLAMRMIARSFALSASARRSVASALRSVWLPFA